MKKEKDTFIESLLFSDSNIVKYSKENPVEVKPGIYAPIFVNLKQTLSEYSIRHTLAKKLVKLIKGNVDFVCGMESGGTYYASVVADILLKPLILFRKKNKECGNHDRIVGNLPPKGSKIAIIDDVIATGLAVSDAISYFQSIYCKVRVFSVFNYSPDNIIASKLGVDVRSLSNFIKLCEVAQKNKKFSKEDVNFLMEHTSTYKDFKIK